MRDCENLTKKNKRVGVYCIFNTSNGRRYVGSSNNLWRRFLEHRRHLQTGIHDNQFLQNDYNKSHSDAFIFFILQECSENQRIVIEQKWIDALWDNRALCYNLDSTAGSRTHWIPSAETRKKMSEAHRGKKRGPCSPERAKAISEANKGRTGELSAEGRKRMVESKQKTYAVQLLAPDGTVYGPIINLHAFCREHELDRASILRLINGKQGRVGMWKLVNPIWVDRRFKYVGEDYKLRKKK
jgi:group I intron endonuclease